MNTTTIVIIIVIRSLDNTAKFTSSSKINPTSNFMSVEKLEMGG